ncbi:GGDEF domain-containing protein [Nisaea acidiphila]|uniref:diguanylate cyclase n=1 Tax=Nisaea acidiphila TaxID=1862145 RepID=A0A9J7AXF6_9PROT|nr:GGDEF domain-containing protein [Nisaea acidiphila]UUX50932.1 GGDEF domain-containing protein [Nisaea acidiphila]
MSGFMHPQDLKLEDTQLTSAFANLDVGNLLSRMPAEIATRASEIVKDAELDDTEIALRLAMIAMTEAENRIARQEKRIAHLESLSVTDELTGLLNRRGFAERLQSALAACKRQGITGTLLMIDLDKFKAVNDTYGHAAGDALLITVARILQSRTRETDSVARLGGDEFAVIMSGADEDDAQARINALDHELNTRILQWNGSAIHLHASVGHDAYGPDDTEPELLDRVDRAMYARKQESVFADL